MPESPSSTRGSPASIQAPAARWARVAGGRSGSACRSKSARRLVRGNLASLTRRIRRRASRSSHSAVRTSARNALWDRRSWAAASAIAAASARMVGSCRRRQAAADRGLGGGLGQRGHRRLTRPAWRAVVLVAVMRVASSGRAAGRSRPAIGGRPRPARRPCGGGRRHAASARRRRWPGGLEVAAGLDRDQVGIEAAQRERGAHPGEHRGGGQGAVQQQHPDQRPGARPVAEPRAGRRPRTVDAPAVNAPPARAATSAVAPASAPGLAGQHLQVVVQHQVLGALVQDCGVVSATTVPASIDDRPWSRRAGPRAAPGVAGRAPSSRTGAHRSGPWHRPGTTTARATSNTSAGNGRSSGSSRAAAGADGLGPGRDPPGVVDARRRRPSPRSARPAIATCGTGVRCRRRNRPISPSTPPFSCAPSIPGRQKNES